MASGPDLFVVCKHCGAEVSPYITECPYCGNRIQKRAPKLDRDQRIAEKKAPRRPAAPSLPRLRRGEIPGIRHEAHPYATLTLVALAFVGTLLWRTGAIDLGELIPSASLKPDWWHALTAPFVYDNTGYAVITVGVIAIFGWLLENRHGPLAVILLFALGGFVGIGIGVEVSPNLAYGVDGGNGAALALLVAWAIPDVLEAIRGEDFEGDLIGVAVIGAVIALMPLIAPEAAWVTDAVGVAAGILIGYPLARLHPA